MREYDTIHPWSVNWDPQSDAEINDNDNDNDNDSRRDLAKIANTKRVKCYAISYYPLKEFWTDIEMSKTRVHFFILTLTFTLNYYYQHLHRHLQNGALCLALSHAFLERCSSREESRIIFVIYTGYRLNRDWFYPWWIFTRHYCERVSKTFFLRLEIKPAKYTTLLWRHQPTQIAILSRIYLIGNIQRRIRI